MMKQTKRIAALLLALVLALGVLAGCGSKEVEEEATTVRIGCMKGPTAMGLVKLFSEADAGKAENTYTYQIAGAADELTPLLLKGELDVLAVPANMASVLYNKSEGAVQVLAVNTLGVLYILEKGGESVQNWEALKGQTIYASGKGASPEYALNYLLQQHGLTPGEDVTVEWCSEHAEVVTKLAQAEHAVALLPQPFVTVAQTKVEGLHVALDMTKAWDELQNGSQCITGCLVVRKDFAQQHPQTLAKFLTEYAASTDFANNSVADCAALVEQYGILEKAAIAEKAIPACNIVCISGEQMVPVVKGYLQVLFDQNPAAVGGTMPADEFYYVG